MARRFKVFELRWPGREKGVPRPALPRRQAPLWLPPDEFEEYKRTGAIPYGHGVLGGYLSAREVRCMEEKLGGENPPAPTHQRPVPPPAPPPPNETTTKGPLPSLVEPSETLDPGR